MTLRCKGSSAITCGTDDCYRGQELFAKRASLVSTQTYLQKQRGFKGPCRVIEQEQWVEANALSIVSLGPICTAG
jgi:hypothetical protein